MGGGDMSVRSVDAMTDVPSNFETAVGVAVGKGAETGWAEATAFPTGRPTSVGGGYWSEDVRP